MKTNDADSTREEQRGGNESDDQAGGTNRAELAGAPADDQWLTGDSVLKADLPDDVGIRLGRLLGDDPVETLGDWVAEVRRHTGGGSIAVEELCHADVDTPHWGTFDGHTYHFRCFYDAVILSALVDDPVDVRTESPGGEVIKVEAAGTDGLRVTPEEAVFSFGVDEHVDPPTDGGPSNEDVYSAVCPYVRAFPDAATYEEWAESVPAVTVALPLSGATDVAAALVE